MDFAIGFGAQLADPSPARATAAARLRRRRGVRRAGRVRPHLGTRAPLAEVVRAHECARDLPELRSRAHVHDPCRTRRGAHAVQLQPSGARRRARRNARCALGRAPRSRRRPGRDPAGDDALQRRPRAHLPRGRGVAADDQLACGSTTSSRGTASSTSRRTRSCPVPCSCRIPRCSWRAARRTPSSWRRSTASARCARLRGHRRSSRLLRPLPRDDRQNRDRRTLRVDRRPTTPSRRCCPRSCSTTATRRSASARAANGSSPSRSRTGTAASPPPSEDTEDDDNVAEIAQSRERVVAKLHEANVPVSRSPATFNVDHAYGTADYAIAVRRALARSRRRRGACA